MRIKAYQVKLKNRRVILIGPHNGEYIFRFKMLEDDRSIKDTKVTVSRQALEAMYALIENELTLDNKPTL